MCPEAYYLNQFLKCCCNQCNHNNFISLCKAENGVLVTKALINVTNLPLSTNTVHQYLKKAGIKDVVKYKHPLLSPKYSKVCLDFAYTHKN